MIKTIKIGADAQSARKLVLDLLYRRIWARPLQSYANVL